MEYCVMSYRSTEKNFQQRKDKIMTEEYRNSGNLFTPIETSIVRQGRVNVDGVTKNMLIVKSKDREGMEYFNLYFESAKIYKTEKKDDNSSDMDGTINAVIEGQVKPMKFWLRRKTSEKGTDYTNVSLQPKQNMNGATPVKEMSLNDMDESPKNKNPLDDEIPF